MLAGKQLTTTGSISFISPQVNSDAQAILVKAFCNEDGKLRDGNMCVPALSGKKSAWIPMHGKRWWTEFCLCRGRRQV